MRQLTAVGDQHTIALGRVYITAQLATCGGVTITVWAGPDRRDAVAFSYADRRIARTRYAQIRQLAASGATAEQIDQVVNGGGSHAVEAVRDILRDAVAAVAADNSAAGARLAAPLQAAIEATEPQAEQDRLDALADDIRAHLSPARSFAEIRDRHAAAIERDRKAVA